jgi:hypothetical protein
MKKYKPVFKFFSLSPEINELAKNKILPRIIAPSHVERHIIGMKGLNYRGLDLYYVAYQDHTKTEIGTLERQKKAIAKLLKLKKALESIDNGALSTVHDQKLSHILGATVMSAKRIKAEIKSIMKEIQYSKEAPTKYLIWLNTKEAPAYIYVMGTNKNDFSHNIRTCWKNLVQVTKQGKRNQQKTAYSTQRRTPYGNLTLVGGVHNQPNEFCRLRAVKMRDILKNTKLPMTKERHIGVEIEASIPRDNLESLNKALINTGMAQYMAMGTDGSVTANEDYQGSELRLCAPMSKIKEVITAACETLIKFGAVVDKTCGLHVHLDARKVLGVDAEKMFINLVRQQKPLYLTQPSSRRGNTYSKWTSRHDWEVDDRYKSINPTSFSKYNTIEVRLHSGTIIANKIHHWIDLISAIAYGPALKSSFAKVETLLNALEFNGEIREYFLARAEKFKDAPSPVTSNVNRDYSNYQREHANEDHENEEEWPMDIIDQDENDYDQDEATA